MASLIQPDAEGGLLIGDSFVAFVFALFLLGGFGLVAYTLSGRQRLRELAIRERIALIEKGLVPSPESDPARFETLVRLKPPVGSTAARYRSAGVIVMGLGFAMMVLLAFAAGVPEVGLGIGGGLVIIGLAAFINGTLMGRDDPHSTTLP
jgi:hypothetical protein